MSALFEKAVLQVSDPQSFSSVRGAIEAAFSATRVADFLKSLERGGLRVRAFEAVLKAGKLGSAIASDYSALGNGDQGQIREFYLASLEKVAPDVRERFFKLYAYY